MTERFKKERARKSMALHLTEKQLAAVAKVAIRSAMLDQMIDLTFAQLIKRYPNVLQKAAEEFSGPHKIQLIKDTLLNDLPEHKHAILDFISEIMSSRSERNDIIHRIWRLSESADKLD